MRQNRYLFYTCMVVNLLIGNLALLGYSGGEAGIIHCTIASLCATLIHLLAFYITYNREERYSIFKLILITVTSCLSAMLVACVAMTISTRMEYDGLLESGLKGILPIFIFAIPIASPLWVPLSIWNFICLRRVKIKGIIYP